MKQKKSGETKGSNIITVEGDINALKKDTPVEGYEYGANLDTDGTPLIDTGIGGTISIRTFEFKINPEVKELPDRQTLFNHHARQINTILWADGLWANTDYAPRVIIDAKKHNYKIHVVCEARANQLFIDSPMNLSEQLLKEGQRKNETTRH